MVTTEVMVIVHSSTATDTDQGRHTLQVVRTGVADRLPTPDPTTDRKVSFLQFAATPDDPEPDVA